MEGTCELVSTRIHDEQVVEWRRRRLSEAGFGPRAAQDLAQRRGVDLHELLGLVDRGCPPHLAIRIVT